MGSFYPCPNARGHTGCHGYHGHPPRHRLKRRVHRHGCRERNATRLAKYDGRQYTRTRGYRWWGNRRGSAPRRNGRKWHHNSGANPTNTQPGTQPGTPVNGRGSSSDESSRPKGERRCRCIQRFYPKGSANNIACHRQTYRDTLLSCWRRSWEYFAEAPTGRKIQLLKRIAK